MNDPKNNGNGKDPEWLGVARGELDTKEIPGKENNPRILLYQQATSLKAQDDETPWCSAFVNWCMMQAGVKGTNLATARSWLVWGKDLPFPKYGCVTILRRGKSPWQGHVGFFISEHGSFVEILGGNQHDEVSISTFPKENVLAYRWPSNL